MFTVQLSDAQGIITAQAPTVANAVGFICDYFACELPLESGWQRREGCWVMAVYDWYECWYPDAVVLAYIIAPPSFSPPPNKALQRTAE